MRLYGNRVGPSSNMTGVLLRRRPCEDRHTWRQTPHEVGAMHLLARGHQRFLESHHPLGRAKDKVLGSFHGEHGLADTLISDLWPPEK